MPTDTNDTVIAFEQPLEFSADPLTEIVRKGARDLLAAAVEAEVTEFLAQHAHELDDQGRQRVVRHGHLPPREITTGIGKVSVEVPRVRDRVAKGDDRYRFYSKLVPPYLRKSKSLEELLPALYLRGVSSGDFTEALEALLGKDAEGLSHSTISRLKTCWWDQYQQWSKASLADKKIVYIWADGVYFTPRLDGDRQCILVIIGADTFGNKHLLSVADGFRESAESWKDVLSDLKDRGITTPPKLAVGDGALGFWSALRDVYPETIEQRCWVHKTANVLGVLPKSMQSRAKADLHEIWMAETKADANKAFDAFIETYALKYVRAVEKLVKDRDCMLAFYDFPAEHWKHIRTTNPIESTFATVRNRTRKTKGCLSRKTALAMVYKMAMAAQKRWKKLHGANRLPEIITGVVFKDGISQQQIQHAA